MGGGLTFLSKKGFNPANTNNQKAVWEARQRKQLEHQKAQERKCQLKREREEEELAKSRFGAQGGHQAALRFMYDAPPGTNATERTSTITSTKDLGQSELNKATDSSSNLLSRQPGDDDAAAQFRMLLACNAQAPNVNSHAEEELAPVDTDTPPTETTTANINANANTSKSTGGVDTRSSLEKAVGKRDTNKFLSLEEQVQRFPQLKNAPMVKGMTSSNINVNFKPMGTQFRNIRCLKCGQWGHSRGDRECSLSGWDPFKMTTVATSTTSDVNANANANANVDVNDVDADNEKRKASKQKSSNDSDDDHHHSTSDTSSNSDDDSYDRRRHISRKRSKKSSSRKRKHRDRHSSRYEHDRSYRSRERDRDKDQDRDRDRDHDARECSRDKDSDTYRDKNDREGDKGRHSRRRRRHHDAKSSKRRSHDRKRRSRRSRSRSNSIS